MTARKTAPAKKPAAKRAAPAAQKPAAKRAAPRKTPAAKALQQVVNRYDVGGNGRRIRGWNPPNSGPNRAVENIDNIRKRSRDSIRNDWAAASAVQHWVTNLIGTGIVPRLKRVTSKDRKKMLSELWDRWCKECDADGALDYYGLQSLWTRAWFESGECFIRLRPRRMDSGMEVPLQIQLIEADYVPMLDAENWPGMPRGNRIRSGIELDRSGQRVAYWVYKEHPKDGQSSIGANDLVRVPRSRMLHIYEPKRPGQLRGVPELATVLAGLRTDADYDDNVAERMKIANLFMAFIRRPSATGLDDTVDPLTGQPIANDNSGTPMVAMEPATAQELLPGEDVTFANPPEPGTMYHEYKRTRGMQTAAGSGLPNELLTGDLKEISDRTLRVAINEFRRFCEQRQWHIIIPQGAQRIRDAWVETAALVGLVSMTEMQDVSNVLWQPQAWPYIHPVQDVQAKVEEVTNRFRSRSSVIAERGDDPDVVDDEIAADKEREEELGIAPVPPAAPGGQQQADGDGIAPGEYPRNRALDNLTATVARLEAAVKRPRDDSAIEHFIAGLSEVSSSVAQVASSVAALAAKPTDIRVENIVPAPEVKVDVAAPSVSVENTVPVPEVKVDVAAPSVSVTNEVQPAEVQVHLPERETTSVIERDREGNITNVTQTERTIQ